MEQMDTTEGQPIPCQWTGCEKVFANHLALANHLSEDHVQWKKSLYMCDWKGCSKQGMPCLNRFAMIMHMRTHTGEKPYKCIHSDCGQIFNESESLVNHLKADHHEQTTMETNKEKIKENNKENNKEKNIEKNTENNKEKNTVKNTIKNTVKNTVKNTEKDTEKSTEKNMEKNTEKNMEKNMEKNTEKNMEKNREKNTNKNTEKSLEKSSEKNPEKSSEKILKKESLKGKKTAVKRTSAYIFSDDDNDNHTNEAVESKVNKKLLLDTTSDYSQYQLAKLQLNYLLRENDMLQDEYNSAQKKLKRLRTERRVLLDTVMTYNQQ